MRERLHAHARGLPDDPNGIHHGVWYVRTMRNPKIVRVPAPPLPRCETCGQVIKRKLVATYSERTAVEWLAEFMRERGPYVDGGEVLREAETWGIPRTSLHRARQQLGLTIEYQTDFGPRRTRWCRPF
jgi:hypothetical protein